MAKPLESIDISHAPDVLQLAEEVRRAGEPRVLRRGGEELALISPLPRPRRRRVGRAKTEADYAAFRSAAGGWKGLVDVDQFIQDVYESRRISTRPPVEL